MRIFRQMSTQWRVTPFVAGKHVVFARSGLDYGALEPIARALDLELSEGVLDGLRILEQTSLQIFAKRQIERTRG